MGWDYSTGVGLLGLLGSPSAFLGEDFQAVPLGALVPPDKSFSFNTPTHDLAESGTTPPVLQGAGDVLGADVAFREVLFVGQSGDSGNRGQVDFTGILREPGWV